MTTAVATVRHDNDSRRLAYGALLAFTVLVAAVTFVLSFSGLDDYGRRVAELGILSPLVPLGVDGLTLCAVAATFLLRRAAWHVRLYAWCVFGVAVAASVAGNLSHAAAKSLSWEGMVGAAAWPILLALASHLVIVVRRNMERAGQPTATAAPIAEPVPAVARAPGAPRQPRATPVRDNDLIRQRARDMYRDGTPLRDIAKTLSVHKRSVERYTKDLRQPVPA